MLEWIYSVMKPHLLPFLLSQTTTVKTSSLKCQFIKTTLIWKAKAIFITYIHTLHFELSDYKGQQWVSQNRVCTSADLAKFPADTLPAQGWSCSSSAAAGELDGLFTGATYLTTASSSNLAADLYVSLHAFPRYFWYARWKNWNVLMTEGNSSRSE